MYRSSPSDVISQVSNVSSLRISSYKSFFNLPNYDEAYGVYCWNNELSSRINLAIGTYEILLRNRIHKVLSQFFFNNPKYRSGELHGSEESCAWYDHLSDDSAFKKCTEQGKMDKQGNLLKNLPYPHQMISKLSHGKWRYVFKVTETKNGKKIPWNSLLKDIFTDFNSSFELPSKRELVFSRLKQVHLLRNRIAHFEPVWKYGELWDEQGKKKINDAPANPVQAIGRTKSEYKNIIDIMSWISSSACDFYKETRNHREIVELISISSINSFKRTSETIYIDIKSPSLANDIEAALATNYRRNSSICLIKDNEEIGVLR